MKEQFAKLIEAENKLPTKDEAITLINTEEAKEMKAIADSREKALKINRES